MFEPALLTALIALAAILLDWLLGEPRRWHLLVYFGGLAAAIESLLNKPAENSSRNRISGIFALLLMVIPFTTIAMVLLILPTIGVFFSVLLLYFCIGHKSLHDHARPVVSALQNNNEKEARRLAGYMVSRDTESLDIITATTESVLENGNDSVFGALFWFAVAGAPGVILYRLVNTLDAMWGYRNLRYQHFGWAAARFDDVLNYLPARLTALSYALMGETRQAFSCWQTQAAAWDSPNAGPVMAAGAGVLGIRLGGAACYQGQWHPRPVLGVDKKPVSEDIERALKLIRHGVWLWLSLFLIAGGLAYA